jgi:hypothetical protein
MIRQIADFASARSETPELADINQMAKAACDFLSLDSRFHSTRIELRPDTQLPACVVIPDYLHEALSSLLQACVENDTVNSKPARLVLETKSDGLNVKICIVCEPAISSVDRLATDSLAASRFSTAQRRIAAMGGQIVRTAMGMEIVLPIRPPLDA